MDLIPAYKPQIQTLVCYRDNSWRFLFTHKSLCWELFLEVMVSDLLNKRILSHFSSGREKVLLRRKKNAEKKMLVSRI